MSNSIKLEVGGSYRTRDGRFAQIEWVDEECNPPVYWGKVGRLTVSYSPNGSYFGVAPSPLDITTECSNPIQLVVGRRYISRDGRTAEIRDKHRDPAHPFPFRGIFTDFPLSEVYWTNDGKYSWNLKTICDGDLVSEYSGLGLGGQPPSGFIEIDHVSLATGVRSEVLIRVSDIVSIRREADRCSIKTAADQCVYSSAESYREIVEKIKASQA